MTARNIESVFLKTSTLLSAIGKLRSHRISTAHRHQSADTQKSTHFGFETVPIEEKEERVRGVFSNVAESYDLMNDAMSLGIHRLWKDAFVRELAPTRRTKLLDVAGGTGDIAFRCMRYMENLPPDDGDNFLEEHNQSSITVCDINEEMLAVGRQRAAKLDDEKFIWQQGNAECLPFPDDSFDAYTIAFGIRNVTRLPHALAEAHRVLRRHGRFLCLEFSQVHNPLLLWLYDQYSTQVIPPLGLVLAQDWRSYQYLVESIRMFPDQEEFMAMIVDAGFGGATFRNLSGGIVSIHSGFKL